MEVLYYNNKSNAAYKNHNATEMAHYITLSEKLIEQHNLVEENDDINLLKFEYEYLCKNYTKALPLSKILMDSYQKREEMQKYMVVLNIKNDILYKTNQKDEALIGYKNYAALKDSLSSSEFYKYLASFRSQRDFDNLEMTNQRLEMEASHDHFQMSMLKYGVGLMILICLIMGVAVWLFRRSSIESKKARMKAEEADRMKTIFLDNMNHEIRTPLNAIVGFSQILIEEDDQKSRQEYADIILQNNDLLERLIGDVLDFSRIETNSMKFSNVNVALLPIMKDLHKTISLRMPKDVKLILKDSENISIFTDPLRLIQIFSNLLNNAMKHTTQGYIQFGYINENTTVRFFVEDTGEGIPEDKIDLIFKRFTKLNPFDKGVGLGLAICKGLVEKMGGTISVTSTLGKGSTFWFTLPVSKSDNANMPAS
jgi:signal transduction histidine kinase